jgi:hypothetical protein
MAAWLLATATAVLATATATPAAPAIKVRGDTTCPTPAEVSAALVGLVATAPATAAAPVPAAPGDVVDLAGQNGSVSIRLSNAARELIAERRLPASLSCDERARAAAVVVAAWEARLRAITDPLARPVTIALVPPPVPPPPSTTTLTGDHPVSPPSPDLVLASAQLPSPADAPIQVQVDAALLASVAAASVSPAALVQATFLRRDAAFALGIGALAVGTHATSVAPGRGTWRRLGGLLELQSISRWRAVALSVHGGIALTALDIAGRSLPTTAGAVFLDPGALLGARVRFRAGAVSPWLEAAAASWPRTHSLYVDGSAASTPLPPFELLLGAGLSLGTR